jgi:hypothetical protein
MTHYNILFLTATGSYFKSSNSGARVAENLRWIKDIFDNDYTKQKLKMH